MDWSPTKQKRGTAFPIGDGQLPIETVAATAS
jgi:hypothetical protein